MKYRYDYEAEILSITAVNGLYAYYFDHQGNKLFKFKVSMAAVVLYENHCNQIVHYMLNKAGKYERCDWFANFIGFGPGKLPQDYFTNEIEEYKKRKTVQEQVDCSNVTFLKERFG